ncbi:MAG: SAM-dependent methyltransferase [Lachnospiraceae bacterium]|nr:SAM-dependent methyltransferase [Lachnospiraceae bacterium]
MLQLSKRLQAVADLAGNSGILADVGTDHGYIPVYLLGCGKIQKAIAMDINQGPLMRALEHIRQYDMEDLIETRLSDGLSELLPTEADTIVIAGMGGALMMQILSQKEETAHAAGRLVLQPQSELFAFRCFLEEQGYDIMEEDMVYEDGKFYSMMAAEYSETAAGNKRFSDTELKYGPLLIRRRHPVLRNYLLHQREQKEKILASLEKNAKRDVSQRKMMIRKELTEIEQLLQMWKEQVT